VLVHVNKPGELQKRIEEVLAAHPELAEQHPLSVSDSGTPICHGCHLYLGDPVQHLLDALQRPLTAPLSDFQRSDVSVDRDRRESSIEWTGGDAA
jgi:hypothetical protein